MATKTTRTEPSTDPKELMFDDFFHAAKGTMEALQLHYNVTGVVKQIFGIDVVRHEDKDAAKEHLRRSSAWKELSALYDYALHGIVSDMDGPDSIVINGSDVLKLASSEEWWPSSRWDDIIAMGDGRFALDDGQDIMIYKLALLANVDQRTVRNAISAGQLVAHKKYLLVEGEQLCVENTSARLWLLGRKGFKPTVQPTDLSQRALHDITTTTEFAGFLAAQRQRVGLDPTDGKLAVLHHSVNDASIAQLEAGVFAMPLDAVFPLADFYQLNRKDFLACVMRVFFADELEMLSQSPAQAVESGA